MYNFGVKKAWLMTHEGDPWMELCQQRFPKYTHRLQTQQQRVTHTHHYGRTVLGLCLGDHKQVMYNRRTA